MSIVHSTRPRILLGIGAAALCSLVFAAPAAALDFEVNTDGEGPDAGPGDTICEVTVGLGDCTLRAAVGEANATSAPDGITFSGPDTYSLSGAPGLGTLGIIHPLTIDGEGSGLDGTVVDGDDTFRLFSVTPGVSATLRDMRLQDGGLNGGDSGAAMQVLGSVDLTDVTLISNQIVGGGGGNGAAIATIGSTTSLTLTDSIVTDNEVNTTSDAGGGGIYVEGTLNLNDSTVSDNTVTVVSGNRQGGGIYALGPFTIDRSTISANTITAGGEGGGIYTAGSATKAITNSTISGNSAGNGTGGGLRTANSVTLESNTFALNSAANGGADILADGTAVVTPENSILASSAPTSCGTAGAGVIGAGPAGHNIDVGVTCGFGVLNGNQQNVSASGLALGPLAQNGPATTMTHAIGPGSAALDAGSDGDCGGLGVDQRGVIRPQPTGGTCDVGAFELEYRTLTVSPSTGTGTGSVTATGINCPGDCTESVPQGSAVTLTAAPSAGSTFTGWTGCDSAVGNQCTQTAGADEAVTAAFALNPPVVVGDPPVDNSAACAALKKKLKKKLKKAKSKKAKKKFRKKIRALGC